MVESIILTKTECLALYSVLYDLLGGCPGQVFRWDGEDSPLQASARALAKVYHTAGKEIPNNLLSVVEMPHVDIRMVSKQEGVTMKFLPLGDRIIVRQEEPESQSKGGILLPDVSKEKPLKGEVLALGPGKWVDGKLEKSSHMLHTGSTVLFPRYAGTEVQVGEEKYLVLNASDVLGILE